MSSKSENLKVIFFEPASDTRPGNVVADGYFSFVPTFKEGDEINMTIARRETTNATVHDPIGHKTHRILKTDWVIMFDERSKEALATLVVSVEAITPASPAVDYTTAVATHS